MRISIALAAVGAAVLLFFGFIFLLSAGAATMAADPGLQTIRLVEGGVLILVGFALAYAAYSFSRQPTKIVQQLELSGQMKAASIQCPNCSASVDASAIKIMSGVPYATCPYCGTTFEVAEEPKW